MTGNAAADTTGDPSRRARVFSPILAAALLLVGAVAVAGAPDEDGLSAPIAVPGAVGQTVSSRTLVAEVTGVRAGTTAAYPDALDAPEVRTKGVWLAVDVVLRGQNEMVGIANAELHVGTRRFDVYDGIPHPSLSAEPVRPGVPTRGTLVFEVPRAAMDAGSAELWLKTSADMHLDDVPVVHLDLRSVKVADTVRVGGPGLAEP